MTAGAVNATSDVQPLNALVPIDVIVPDVIWDVLNVVNAVPWNTLCGRDVILPMYTLLNCEHP